MGESSKDTRTKIIDAMYYLSADRGYDNTSIGSICDVVGITKPSVYYYFASKEEIYLEMLDSIYVDLSYEDIFSKIKDPDKYRDKLLNLGNVIIDNYRDDEVRRKVIAEMNVQSARIPSIQEHQVRMSDEMIESLTSILKLGVDLGVFSSNFDVHLRAQTLYILMSGFSQSYANHEHIDERQVWTDTISLFLSEG